MAGSHIRRLRGGPFAAALALSLCLFAGPALAQNPSPPVPATGIPAQNLSDLLDSELSAPEPNAGPMTVTQPLYYPVPGAGPASPRVVQGIFGTITESVFGHPDPDTWRPLPCSTLFSEGWDEAWVPSPNGSGGAPRQGWINAADGNMYRLWFFTFGQAFNQGDKSNAYLGAYTLYTPLSRRLLLITNIPFVLRNSAASGLPTISPSGLTDADVEEPHDIRRYLVHAPRLAARDARLLANGRGRGAGPDRQPAPCGEDRPDSGRQLLEQFRGPVGGPRRAR